MSVATGLRHNLKAWCWESIIFVSLRWNLTILSSQFRRKVLQIPDIICRNDKIRKRRNVCKCKPIESNIYRIIKCVSSVLRNVQLSFFFIFESVCFASFLLALLFLSRLSHHTRGGSRHSPHSHGRMSDFMAEKLSVINSRLHNICNVYFLI